MLGIDVLLAGWLAVSSGGAGMSPRPLMTASDLAELPQPAPDHRLQYGPGSLNFGEMRLPDGPGPHPVAIVVHGGCWLAEYDLGYMSALAADLASAGVATWSVEYRRVGDDGGGWPGTFEDVAAAADFLRTVADSYHLDLQRVVAVGHSAGGHLAMWLAGRRSLRPDDPLRGPDPLGLRGVVALAGIFDLAAYAAPEGCGSAVAPLLGGDPDEVLDRVRRASPIELAPQGVPQVLVIGALDPIVPREQARSYERVAAAAGDAVEVREIEGAGHFELVVPETEAFASVREAVLGLVRPER